MTDLTSRLTPIADLLCNKRNRMVRLIGTPAAECQDQHDFRHFAMVAAFNALVDLGGNPDDPATWPPDALLLPRARTWLARDLQASGTTFGDWRARYARRDLTPRLRWDAWRAPAPSNARTKALVTEEIYQQDLHLNESARQGLYDAVRAVLNEYESYVVYEHFWRGRTVRDIAKAIAEGGTPVPNESGEPFVPRGRVEKRVQKLLQRALERAEKRLGAEWRMLAEAA